MRSPALPPSGVFNGSSGFVIPFLVLREAVPKAHSNGLMSLVSHPNLRRNLPVWPTSSLQGWARTLQSQGKHAPPLTNDLSSLTPVLRSLAEPRSTSTRDDRRGESSLFTRCLAPQTTFFVLAHRPGRMNAASSVVMGGQPRGWHRPLDPLDPHCYRGPHRSHPHLWGVPTPTPRGLNCSCVSLIFVCPSPSSCSLFFSCSPRAATNPKT